MALCHRCQAVEVELQEQHIATLHVDPMERVYTISQASAHLGISRDTVHTWITSHRVLGLAPPLYRPRAWFPRYLERVLRPSDVRAIGAHALRSLRSQRVGHRSQPWSNPQGMETAAARARSYRQARSGAQPRGPARDGG